MKYTRKSDGKAFSVTIQARSIDGPVELVAGDGEVVKTTNDKLSTIFRDSAEAVEPSVNLQGFEAKVMVAMLRAAVLGHRLEFLYTYGNSAKPRQTHVHVHAPWESEIGKKLVELGAARVKNSDDGIKWSEMLQFSEPLPTEAEAAAEAVTVRIQNGTHTFTASDAERKTT